MHRCRYTQRYRNTQHRHTARQTNKPRSAALYCLSRRVDCSLPRGLLCSVRQRWFSQAKMSMCWQVNASFPTGEREAHVKKTRCGPLCLWGDKLIAPWPNDNVGHAVVSVCFFPFCRRFLENAFWHCCCKRKTGRILIALLTINSSPSFPFTQSSKSLQKQHQV